MNIKSYKFALLAIATFIIVFLMNYIGNEESDKLYRASLNGIAGVVGITVGMWFLNRNKDDKTPPPDFD